MNWQGKPLRSHQTIVQPMAATRTGADPMCAPNLMKIKHLKGMMVSGGQLATFNTSRHPFHGSQNCKIAPG
jgi:hypothetical protein